jgi:hypothetical protein
MHAATHPTSVGNSAVQDLFRSETKHVPLRIDGFEVAQELESMHVASFKLPFAHDKKPGDVDGLKPTRPCLSLQQ